MSRYISNKIQPMKQNKSYFTKDRSLANLLGDLVSGFVKNFNTIPYLSLRDYDVYR